SSFRRAIQRVVTESCEGRGRRVRGTRREVRLTRIADLTKTNFDGLIGQIGLASLRCSSSLPPRDERGNFWTPAAAVQAMPLKVVGAKNSSVKSPFLAILSAQEMREGQAQAETTALPSRRNQLVGGSSSPAEYEAVFFV